MYSLFPGDTCPFHIYIASLVGPFPLSLLLIRIPSEMYICIWVQNQIGYYARDQIYSMKGKPVKAEEQIHVLQNSQ